MAQGQPKPVRTPQDSIAPNSKHGIAGFNLCPTGLMGLFRLDFFWFNLPHPYHSLFKQESYSVRVFPLCLLSLHSVLRVVEHPLEPCWPGHCASYQVLTAKYNLGVWRDFELWTFEQEQNCEELEGLTKLNTSSLQLLFWTFGHSGKKRKE